MMHKKKMTRLKGKTQLCDDLFTQNNIMQQKSSNNQN